MWSEFYTSTRIPRAGDVGALPLSGGQLNGALGIGTSSALGGNSIVLGDNDTGFKQNGDGNLEEPKMLWVRIRKRVRK